LNVFNSLEAVSPKHFHASPLKNPVYLRLRGGHEFVGNTDVVVDRDVDLGNQSPCRRPLLGKAGRR
jgi:hypothetical protein